MDRESERASERETERERKREREREWRGGGKRWMGEEGGLRWIWLE